MSRSVVPAVSPQAATVGYSRAVRDGQHVHVSGTAPICRTGRRPPADAYVQAQRCLEIIVDALEQLGAAPEHVVRTRVYLVDAADWEEVGRAHGEVFGDVRPASAFLVVAGLLDPRWLVEIEAEALVRVKQIYPASITGKGSRFAEGGSVLDHAFGQSDPFTLGVEEEYMLLDAETFDLVQHIDTVLAAVSGHELEPRINPELMQSVLEVATPVCHTPADVAEQLRTLRGFVCGVARERGMRVGSAGTHPFSLFERQRITAKDRYRAMVDRMQYIARRELIFGMHVHVAVDDAEKAIQIVNALIAHLAELVALSASSPFWRGEPTGLASSRHMVYAALAALGAAAALPQLRGLRRGRRPARATGCIADYTHIWWDIRLHPRLGTIEIRICDGVTQLEDVVALTAYCQALVKHYAERYERGRGDAVVPPHPHDREQVARRALRHRGAGDGSRDRPPQPRPRRAARSAGR